MKLTWWETLRAAIASLRKPSPDLEAIVSLSLSTRCWIFAARICRCVP